MTRERTKEASTTVQGRVDLRTLAEMLMFFEEVEGNRILNISQLVNDTIEYCRMQLDRIDALPRKIDNVGDAMKLLIDFRILKGTALQRNIVKLHTAVGFEELRQGGADPKFEAPNRYKQIHRVGSEPSVYSQEHHDNYNQDELVAIAKKAQEEELDKQRKMEEDRMRRAEQIECALKNEVPSTCPPRRPRNLKEEIEVLEIALDNTRKRLEVSPHDEELSRKYESLMKQLEAIKPPVQAGDV